jgi:hypothetical protein
MLQQDQQVVSQPMVTSNTCTDPEGGTGDPDSPPPPQDFQRWGPWYPPSLSLTRGQHEVHFQRFFSARFAHRITITILTRQ